jgi:hypothetical protein
VLDYAQHILSVEEQIEYTNQSPDYLPDLRLMVDPLYYPGAFELKSLSRDGQAVEDYQIEGGQIRLPLQVPLSPGERQLALSYELRLPSPTLSPGSPHTSAAARQPILWTGTRLSSIRRRKGWLAFPGTSASILRTG